MKQHHPLRLGRTRSRISEGGQQEQNKSCSRANAADVKPSGHAVRSVDRITTLLTGLGVEPQQVVLDASALLRDTASLRLLREPRGRPADLQISDCLVRLHVPPLKPRPSRCFLLFTSPAFSRLPRSIRSGPHPSLRLCALS